MTFQLGRKARVFDPRVPHYSSARILAANMGITMPPLQTVVDNASALPGFLGMMLNDQLGDCTCAGEYHSIQVVTNLASGALLTVSDDTVLKLYQEMGYRGGIGSAYDLSSDEGVVEQSILRYLLETGAPLDDGSRHKIAAYVELDVRNFDDICEAIQECGFVYIGFQVPHGFMEDGPPTVWDVKSNYNGIDGGHCVIITGFDRTDPANPVFDVVSWGTRQWKMTSAFWRANVDEAYAIADPLWFEATGKTPLGLSLSDLEQLMNAVRS